MDRSLEELMEAYCDGDLVAFDELFRRVAPRLGSTLVAMTRDRTLAQDIVQTTFLKVHRARDAYQRGAPVMPWVTAIARRTWLDALRSKKRSRTSLTPEGDVPEPSDPTPAIDDDAGFGRLSPEEERTLHDAIDGLPPSQREGLTLLKVEGLSLKEAAAVTGSTVGAIKLRAHRAYEALRKALRGHEPTTTEEKKP